MYEDEIVVNQIAQAIISTDAGDDWFLELPESRRGEVLRKCEFVVSQAHPTSSEIEAAILASGLKRTFTPCVLLSKFEWPLGLRLRKVVALGNAERLKAFRLLVAVLSISDARRRDECRRATCRHWWHDDLANPAVLESIRNGQLSGPRHPFATGTQTRRSTRESGARKSMWCPMEVLVAKEGGRVARRDAFDATRGSTWRLLSDQEKERRACYAMMLTSIGVLH